MPVVNAFLHKDRLERCEAKHDPRRAPAREHGDDDLGLMGSAVCLTLGGRAQTYSLCGGVFVRWCSRPRFCDRDGVARLDDIVADFSANGSEIIVLN